MNKNKQAQNTTKRAMRDIPAIRSWRRRQGGDMNDVSRKYGELLEGAKCYLDEALRRARSYDALEDASCAANYNVGIPGSYKANNRSYYDHGYPDMNRTIKDWPLTETERYSASQQRELLLASAELLIAEVERIDTANGSRRENPTPYEIIDDELMRHQIKRREITADFHERLWRKTRDDKPVDIYPIGRYAGQNVTSSPAVINNVSQAPPTQTSANPGSLVQPVQPV